MLGRSLPNGLASNIEWVDGLAEDSPYPYQAYDLVVAALSIHWMDHDRLFPRLKQHVRPDHVVTVVLGDQPHDPPWEAEWRGFLETWAPEITGVPFDPEKHRYFGGDYRHYIDIIGGQDLVSDPIQESVEDFVKCQHSRDTFTLSKLGERVGTFDAELTKVLDAHAVEGLLTFRVKTTLMWSKIRKES